MEVSRARACCVDRWERFCHAVEYECIFSPCAGDENLPTRHALREHILLFRSFRESILPDRYNKGDKAAQDGERPENTHEPVNIEA